MDFHPAANEFPLLDKKRLGELAEDIKKNGLREDIKLFDGLILDGRNRFNACRMAGVEPRFATLNIDDPYLYAWSLNGERRDLTADQRYLIWKGCHEKSEAWQAEQRRICDEANRKRAEALVGHEFSGNQYTRKEVVVEQPVLLPPQDEAQDQVVVEQPVPLLVAQDQTEQEPVQPSESPAHRNVTREAKAAASKTNRGAVERMDRLSSKRPDLAEKVKIGEVKSAEAMRQMKRDEVADKVAELPPDKYRVIYADPPWSYNDGRTGDKMTATGALHHYPTMPLSEIKAIEVPKLCADDSVLFLWATSPLLPDALEVIKAWGFKYKSSFVWDKVRHNMGHYNSVRHEFLLIATKGSCTPENVKLYDSVQTIERTNKHSEKPEVFREIIDTLYPSGKRVELFARKETNNWETWGNEV